MCVIMLADSSRLTDEMVELGFEANKDGTGIAWREDGLVKWRKGIDFAEAQDLARTLPLPYVAHFRIQTVGGCSQALCHPFPVSEAAELALSGATEGEVLFHNGHWHSWKQMVYDVAARRNVKLPAGKWSDTRAMAWMASQLGIGVLEMIGEKALVLGVEEINIYGSWDVVDDCWVSNTHWKRKAWTSVESHRRPAGFLNTEIASGCESGNYYDYGHRSVSVADRTKPRELPPLKQVGGPATEATFRAGEEGVAGGTHLPRGVEAGAQESGQGKEEGPTEAPQGNRAPLNGRSNTSLILLPGEEVIDDIVWVRSLNPKRRMAQVIDVDTQRSIRTAANAEGKQIIGPL